MAGDLDQGVPGCRPLASRTEATFSLLINVNSPEDWPSFNALTRLERSKFWDDLSSRWEQIPLPVEECPQKVAKDSWQCCGEEMFCSQGYSWKWQQYHIRDACRVIEKRTFFSHFQIEKRTFFIRFRSKNVRFSVSSAQKSMFFGQFRPKNVRFSVSSVQKTYIFQPFPNRKNVHFSSGSARKTYVFQSLPPKKVCFSASSARKTYVFQSVPPGRYIFQITWPCDFFIGTRLTLTSHTITSSPWRRCLSCGIFPMVLSPSATSSEHKCHGEW